MLTMRCSGLPWTILDVLRLNYLCMMQGSTNVIVYAYTNKFTTAEITSLKLNDGAAETTDRNVTLTLTTDNGTRRTRWAFSEEELEKTAWEESYTEKAITLPEEEGQYTVYAQVLSKSFVPSYTKSASITLIPEPLGAAGYLLVLLGLATRKK